MAQQARHAARNFGNMFPGAGPRGIGTATGALIALGAVGYGINASLFNGKSG